MVKPAHENTSLLEIPYRLETVEDISRAMSMNLLDMCNDYRSLLPLAYGTPLPCPPAFLKAKRKVTKDFIKILEDKIQDVDISFRQVAHLPLMDQYPLIIKSLPWVHEITNHDNLFLFLQSFPLKIRERCLAEPLPDSLSGMYSAVLAIRRLSRREILTFLKAGKTVSLSLEQFKQLLVALTLFDPCNEDILQALKTGEFNGPDSALHQNALAELLFARLPQTMQELMNVTPSSLGRKLFSKMSNLGFSSRHIMNLKGYYKPGLTFDDLPTTLSKIDGVAGRIPVSQASKEKLHDYIESLKRNIHQAPSLYKTLFLTKELEACQKLYKPTKVMHSHVTLKERIVKTYTRICTLDFYPTKDYCDLLKGNISHDCTAAGTDLGERQLLAPHFFNVRIFTDGEWIGNIYMLDFSEERGSLIVDRIQIPRELQAYYHHFFEHLRDAMIEMFEGVSYQDILMPTAVSNHGTIQKIFNEYRKKLSRKVSLFESPDAIHFDSIKERRIYYVLHERS